MRTLTVVFLLALAGRAVAEIAAPGAWLVIAATDQRGRRPFNPDRVFERYLLDRTARPPRAGEKIGEQAWKRVAVDAKGRLSGRFAYAYATVEVDADTIALARLPGGGALWVNGDPHVGDIYGSRHSGVPVLLRAGTNHLYVRGMRGGFTLSFTTVERPGPLVVERDATLPFLTDRMRAHTAAVVVLNASTEELDVIRLRVAGEGVADGEGLTFTPIPPLGLRKVSFALLPSGKTEPGEITFSVRAGDGPAAVLKTRVVESGAARRVTFRSGIDDSIQQYALLAPTGDPTKAAIVLSLHGAGVDALGQARAYSAKADFWIVAPTNRRPFGFDWQDWGRKDAYEVLAHARTVTGADRGRLFLTGHSMGGHGTWHLAANDPDAFTAIAPSAGWCSFDTYGGRRLGGKRDLLWRGADGASLTRELIRNLAPMPTFILHGEKDDNVPLSEARLMEEALKNVGGSPEVHVQPGAGHWWDGDAAAGADCVDWPGIFALFRKSRPVADPVRLDFTTADPGVDAVHHWIAVQQPLAYGEKSRVRATRSAASIEIRTANVRRLHVARKGEPVLYSIDEQLVEGPADAWFFRKGGKWKLAEPVAGEKTPARSGPLKRAFDNRFVFVYGKKDREGMLRARYDAQVWWQRGNGDAPVLSDERFLSQDFKGRNVILYGSPKTNAAFEAVLPDSCPIAIGDDGITVGNDTVAGKNLGCAFVYPRAGEDHALVGVFGYTGPAGARAGYALLPFTSGVGYPDYVVFSSSILGRGDDAVQAAGWFEHDWSVRR